MRLKRNQGCVNSYPNSITPSLFYTIQNKCKFERIRSNSECFLNDFQIITPHSLSPLSYVNKLKRFNVEPIINTETSKPLINIVPDYSSNEPLSSDLLAEKNENNDYWIPYVDKEPGVVAMEINISSPKPNPYTVFQSKPVCFSVEKKVTINRSGSDIKSELLTVNKLENIDKNSIAVDSTRSSSQTSVASLKSLFEQLNESINNTSDKQNGLRKNHSIGKI